MLDEGQEGIGATTESPGSSSGSAANSKAAKREVNNDGGFRKRRTNGRYCGFPGYALGGYQLQPDQQHADIEVG